MLIVDSGFSFTHVVPLMGGKVLWKGVRRLAPFSADCGLVWEGTSDNMRWAYLQTGRRGEASNELPEGIAVFPPVRLDG